jgi:hypothetical protein
MTFYDDMQSIASGLLNQFDQGGLQYIALTPGTGPVDNPGAPTLTAHPFAGVSRGVSFRYVGTPGMSGALIVASDLQCTMPVLPGVTPQITGFVQAGASRYKIKSVINIPPTGVTVAHRLIYGK